MTTTRLAQGAVALLGALALTACGGGGHATKAGGSSSAGSAVTVLHLEMPDSGDLDGTFLASDIAAVSHGRVKVEVDTTGAYDNADPAKEKQLVADLRSGKVDLAYTPARGFADAGSPQFQAIQAPFVLSTVTATQAFAKSSLATKYSDGLSALGIVGIGMVPSEPRQITSTRPLIDAADFAGAPVRIIDNTQTAALVTALGAKPVQGLLSTQVGAKLRDGSLVGIESSPTNVLRNGYSTQAIYATTYALFPKLETFAASKSAWSKLSKDDRTALKTALADTIDHAAQVPLREGQALTDMCKSGLVLVEPSASSFAAIVKKASAAMPSDAAATAAVAEIRSTIAGSGPQPQMMNLPPGCKTASTKVLALAAHQSLHPSRFVHKGGAVIPNGTYVVTTTVADFRAGGQVGADWNKAVTWTWKFKDGKVAESQAPDYPDQGPLTGTYAVHGDEVTFTWEANAGLSPETVKWSFFDGQLTYALVDVADTAGKIIFTSHPWRKVS